MSTDEKTYDDFAAVIRELAAAGQFHVVFHVRGTDVPAPVRGQEVATLNFSHGFGTGDLVMSDWALAQTLTFAGRAYKCRVPWANVLYAGPGSAGDMVPPGPVKKGRHLAVVLMTAAVMMAVMPIAGLGQGGDRGPAARASSYTPPAATRGIQSHTTARARFLHNFPKQNSHYAESLGAPKKGRTRW